MSKQTQHHREEKLLDVSDFARTEYGLSAATTTAMLHYGHALMAIAGADGKVSPKEMTWLVNHQRTFGAPEDLLAQYATFDYKNADLASSPPTASPTCPPGAPAPA